MERVTLQTLAISDILKAILFTILWTCFSASLLNLDYLSQLKFYWIRLCWALPPPLTTTVKHVGIHIQQCMGSQPSFSMNLLPPLLLSGSRPIKTTCKGVILKVIVVHSLHNFIR